MAMPGFLQNGSPASLAHRNDLSRTSTLLGRFLLIVTAILIAIMPLTEYLWTFDRGFRGGQDFEFGILSIATIFCMVIVVSRLRRQCVLMLLAARQWIAFACRHIARGIRSSVENCLPQHPADPCRSSSLCLYNLPLQI